MNDIYTFIYFTKNRSILGCFLFFIGVINSCFGQYNLSGKPGLIYIPSANEVKVGELRFGYNYNPINYSLRGNRLNPEQILYVNLCVLPRLEINVNLLQMIDSNKRKVREALGDRQIDIRYLVLKEKTILPSLAIIMSSPFTIDAALLTQALVATKNLQLSSAIQLETTIGYGSPYFIYRDVKNKDNVDILSGFKWEKKSEYLYSTPYLIGVFGGINIKYKKIGGVIAEWDSQKFNVGVFATLFKRWTIQGALLNKDQITFGTSYRFDLLSPSKRIAALHEKNK